MLSTILLNAPEIYQGTNSQPNYHLKEKRSRKRCLKCVKNGITIKKKKPLTDILKYFVTSTHFLIIADPGTEADGVLELDAVPESGRRRKRDTSSPGYSDNKITLEDLAYEVKYQGCGGF